MDIVFPSDLLLSFFSVGNDSDFHSDDSHVISLAVFML